MVRGDACLAGTRLGGTYPVRRGIRHDDRVVGGTYTAVDAAGCGGSGGDSVGRRFIAISGCDGGGGVDARRALSGWCVCSSRALTERNHALWRSGWQDKRRRERGFQT